MKVDEETTSAVPDDDRVAPEPPGAGGLVSARRTAAREHERMLTGAGRTGVLGALAAAAVAVRSLGSAEAAERGLRYQPVIWTVIAVVAVAFFFPGRDNGIAGELAASAPSVTTPFTAPPTTQASPPPTTAPAPAAAPVPTTVARAVSDRVAAPTPAPAPAPAAPAPSPPPEVDLPDSDDDTAPATPLTVEAHAWFGTAGGALSTTSVPEGTLPVANRLGADDKVSVVRLAGAATTLMLTEDPDGASEGVGDAAVTLCVVEESWEEGPGQSMADAPAWSDTCVEGTEIDGSWSFDLAGLADPTSSTGFALVPGSDAPLEFQITFVP